jgi:methionyl-tRNA synthetase
MKGTRNGPSITIKLIEAEPGVKTLKDIKPLFERIDVGKIEEELSRLNEGVSR